MRYLIILLFITLSCKETSRDSVAHKKENVSIDIKKDSIRSKGKFDTIKTVLRNDTLVFQLENVSLYFVNGVNDCWKNIQIKDLKNNRLIEVNTPKEVCFEKNNIADFSPNKKYLLLHAIEKGELSDGDSVKEIEKYNCIFLDIGNVVLSKKNNDLFCSGEWIDQDKWMVDEEESYEAKELFEN
ncbi:hypothetical protein [uncultured Aquimarina sp.]|uniref:hypothetical protein n=1 Tax=uncultured Aquimarina sp. TaxID=575652 RepID=UPI00260161DD|nr:hypothetical protein [uncultured Aquimarina sp.]